MLSPRFTQKANEAVVFAKLPMLIPDSICNSARAHVTSHLLLNVRAWQVSPLMYVLLGS